MTFNSSNAQPPAPGWLFPLDEDDTPVKRKPGAFDDESPYVDENSDEVEGTL